MKQEDIRKICKWCGLHHNEPTGGFWWDSQDNLVIDEHNGEEPDLNFYFKYAVPKLVNPYVSLYKDKMWQAGVWFNNKPNECMVVYGEHKDPAEALASAILKLIESER